MQIRQYMVFYGYVNVITRLLYRKRCGATAVKVSIANLSCIPKITDRARIESQCIAIDIFNANYFPFVSKQ